MRIALVQPKLSRSLDSNLLKTLDAMDVAAARHAELVCFPEIQLSPFFPQYPGLDVSDYAITLDSPCMHKLQQKCQEHGLIGFPNVYLQQGARRFDASPVIAADGSILGVSKMVHVTQAPCFYEQDYYTPSESGFHVYDTPLGRIGVVICFDRHYPESIRSCALQGAQLIIIPTANTKNEPMELFEWELRVPAMQNNVFITMCNRVGLEGEMDFAGESIVVDPHGNVVAKANDEEQILYVDIDLAEVARARLNRPYLSLRRPEVYER